jgi:predicted Ser/Thr protein kinase
MMPSAVDEAPGPEPLLVLEAGSNSLKMYVVSPEQGADSIEVFKYSWTIAHEFFSTGGLSEASFDEICSCIRRASDDGGGAEIAGALAIATGVFRELADPDELFARVKAETGVRLRLISGADEARLMARGLSELPLRPPAMLCDLGGATLEWVWLRDGHEPEFGSVPLGAIRNEYRLAPLRDTPEAYLRESDAVCDAALASIGVDEPVNIVFTGGTSEALASIVGRPEITAAELDELITRVLRDGPPEHLKPSRKQVLLPGLCIIRRVVARFGRGGLRYGSAAVRDGMIRRLLTILEDVPRAALHATLLLRTLDGRDLLAATIRELAPGATLGRYAVVEKLGRGSMGVVYRAVDPQLDREVALKVMRVHGGAADRLLDEAQALAQVAHPNVVAVHDVGRVDDDVFVAMELVEGLTLSSWCRASKRTTDEILQVFLAAGRGLVATHDKRLVQRDFKPDNVIVGHDGRVRLVDFGLARFESDEHEAGFVGTPAYMAPEQFAHASVDARADQFSFCVALWEALYGQPPFAGETVAELEQAVTSGEVTPPPSQARVSQRLQAALRRGLATNPADRFASMHELLAALEPLQRRVVSLAALALTSVAVGAFAVAVAWWWPRERDADIVDPCAGAEQRLVGVWDPAVQQAMREAFARTELPYAEIAFERASKVLDGYAASWVVMATDACEATHVRHKQSEEALAARTACLDARLDHLRALTTTLTGELADVDVDDAVHRAFELPPIEACAKPTSEPVVIAAPSPESAGVCGLPESERFNPISVGRTWVYDVLDPSTQLPRNQEPKILRVEAFEPVGGCKPNTMAYRLRDSAGPGYALRWIELHQVPSPDGHPPGQIAVRHRDQYFTKDDVPRLQEYFEPSRVRLDESCAHTIAGASYVDSYEEVQVAPDSECGEELSRRAKTFDWHVVATDVPIRLQLNYSHPACCGDRSRKRCRPPADGPGHSCIKTEGGGPHDWTCDFTTLQVARSEAYGGKDASYWFAPGVGKVKEHSKGEEIETLVCFAVPEP